MSHNLPRANAILEKLTWGRGKKDHATFLPVLDEIGNFFLKVLGVPSSTKLKISFQKLPAQQKGFLALSPNQINNFEIKLNTAFSFRFFVKTLAHEITHLAQVVRGDLVAGDDGAPYWKGEKVTLPNGKAYDLAHADTPAAFNAYKSLPHEAEAYANEDTLFDKAKAKFDKPIESMAELGIDMNYFD